MDYMLLVIVFYIISHLMHHMLNMLNITKIKKKDYKKRLVKCIIPLPRRKETNSNKADMNDTKISLKMKNKG